MANNIINHSVQDSPALSLKEIVWKYIRFLPLFAFFLGISLIGAWLYLRYATLIFQSTGVMQIKSEEQTASNDKVEQLLSGGNRISNIQNEIEVLRSVPLMNRVVDKLGLQYAYVSVGNIKNYNAYTGSPVRAKFYELEDSSKAFSLQLFLVDGIRFRIGGNPTEYHYGDLLQNHLGKFQLLKVSEPHPGSEMILSYTPTEDMSRSLIEGFGVAPKTTGTGSVNLSLKTTNPVLSADVINTVMKEYDSLTIEQSNHSNDQMIRFIDGRLAILSREIDSVKMELLAYQRQNKIVDAQAQTGAYFEKISESDKLIGEEQLKSEVADYINAYLKDKRNQFSNVVVPSSLGLDDPVLNELVGKYNAAQQERQALLDAKIPSGNPAVKQAESQIELLRKSVLENIRNIRGAILNNIATVRGRMARAESNLQELPYKMKEQVELERLVQTKTALYTLLEEKREQGAIARASVTSNSKIIDLARPATDPIEPDRKTILLMATLIGLLLPMIIIFLKELLNDKINTRSDVEKATSVPIAGEVSNSDKEKLLVVSNNSRSIVSEQFRIIRSNLQYLLPGVDNPVIMVTSSFSGEGKSFISTNFAAVLSLTGRRTIILELDIRKPKVTESLGLKTGKQKGIINFMVGKALPEDIIIKVPEYEELYVMPCGPLPPNPAELLLGSKLGELIEWARHNYDFVVVDTAPVGMVSDAMTIGKFADGTFYVVRQEYTFKKQLEIIEEIGRDDKLPRPAIIINDIRVRGGYGYYGAGRYGYGYGYGVEGYYEESLAKKSIWNKIRYYSKPENWFGK